MNSFNLTFRGEILPGRDPEKAIAGFAALFEITDPARLKQFFSGDTIILRRNLERKVAAEYYMQLNQLGLEAQLVKAETVDTEATVAKPDESLERSGATPRQKHVDKEKSLPKRRPAEKKTRQTSTQRKEDALAQLRQAAQQRKLAKSEKLARKEAAELKAEDERKRKAEEATKLKAEAERKRKAEEAAKLKAEAQRKRKAEEAAKLKAEAQRKRKAEEAAKLKAETELKRKAEDAARKTAGSHAVSVAPSLKRTTAKARVRSRLDLPRKGASKQTRNHRNPPGSPNPYRLLGFRSTDRIRERPVRAIEQSRKGMVIGCIALALLLILLGRFLGLGQPSLINGPTAIAASPGGDLVILAGDVLLLHNRAGAPEEALPARDIGLQDLSGPMVFEDREHLLVAGRSAVNTGSLPRMWRCDLANKTCQHATGEQLIPPPAALTLHDMTGERFIARDGALLKLAANGEMRAQAELELSEKPIIRLDSGLLFLNSAQGPAISVLRYEEQAFGQQLDEILLLPPPAMEREQTRIGDFIRNGDYWWVNQSTPDGSSVGLYLFDQQWRFIRELPRDEVRGDGRLINWGSRVLLLSDQQSIVLRYNEQGQIEAPLESSALADLITREADQRVWVNLAWQSALLLLLLVSLGAFAWAYLQATRALVYRGRPASGAPPLDDIAADIHWLQPAPHRAPKLRQLNLGWTILSLAILVLLIGLGVSLMQLMAATAVLVGPAIAIQLLVRSEPEHLGILESRIVLADHREMYHLASGSRIQYRGAFVLIDDVVIFTGNRWLPGLHPMQLKTELSPRLRAGIRVDRKTIVVKLLQSRHPLAEGLIAIILGIGLGMVLLATSFLPWWG